MNNPCECGCGLEAKNRFVNGHNTRLATAAEQSRRGRLNTGAALLGSGAGKSYRKVSQRHEHRAVAETTLGRRLVPGEVVHHLNGDKRDNNPANLEVLTQADHIRAHHAEMMAARKAKRGY